MAFLLCKNCGNTGHFEQIQCFTGSWSERALFVGTDGPVEYEDRTEGSDCEMQESDPMQCDDCGSEHIEMFETEPARLRYMWEHRKKNGEWSIKKLPDNERDDTVLNEAVCKRLEG